MLATEEILPIDCLAQKKQRLNTLLVNIDAAYGSLEHISTIIKSIQQDEQYDLGKKIHLNAVDYEGTTLFLLLSHFLQTQDPNEQQLELMFEFLMFCLQEWNILEVNTNSYVINCAYDLISYFKTPICFVKFIDHKIQLYNLLLEHISKYDSADIYEFLLKIYAAILEKPDYKSTLEKILYGHIKKFGLYFYAYLSSKNQQNLESILEQIDLSKVSDIHILTSFDSIMLRTPNVFLLKLIYKQRDQLSVLKDKPFFKKIIQYGFNVLDATWNLREEDQYIVEQVLCVCLEKQGINFDSTDQYLEYFGFVIKFNSLKLINLMAEYANNIELSKEVKQEFIANYLSNNLLNGSQKIALIRLSIQWQLSMSDKLISHQELKHLEEMVDLQERNGIEPKKISIEDRLFGHIHSDFWLKGTMWEGNTFGNTMGYIEKILSGSSTLCVSIDIHQAMLKNIRNALDIFHRLQGYYTRSKHYPLEIDYIAAFKFSEQIMKLFASNDYIAIPAGWYDGEGSGHALIYVFAKKNLHNYFMIFNTGDGISHHKKQVEEGRELFSNNNTFRIKDINILNRLMVELLIPVLGKNIKYGASSIYEKILPVFAPLYIEEVTDHEILKELGSKFINPQFSGICSWAVCEAWLESYLLFVGQEDKWSHIIERIRASSLLEYVQSFEHGNLPTVGQKRLMGLDHVSQELLQSPDSDKLQSLSIVDQHYVIEQKFCEVFESTGAVTSMQELTEILRSVIKPDMLLEPGPLGPINELFDELKVLPASNHHFFEDLDKWDLFHGLCKNLIENNRFNEAIYYIEWWISKVDFLTSPILLHDQQKLGKLIKHITNLNSLYISAIKKCGITIYTKEKIILLWSSFCFCQVCEKYLQTLLNNEQSTLLYSSFVQSMSYVVQQGGNKCLIFDDSFNTLLEKINQYLDKYLQVGELALNNHVVNFIGIVGAFFPMCCETARTLQTPSSPCVEEENNKIMCLFKLWQDYVKNGYWHNTMIEQHGTNLDKIDALFGVGASFLLNMEYCMFDFSVKYKNDGDGGDVKYFISNMYICESNKYNASDVKPYIAFYLSYYSSDPYNFKTISEQHLIMQVATVHKDFEEEEEFIFNKENILQVFLDSHFKSYAREAYYIYKVLETEFLDEYLGSVLKVHFVIDFIREYRTRLVDFHYQNFIFHSLFQHNIFLVRNMPVFTELLNALAEGLSFCQKDDYIDLSIFFYLKMIYSLYKIKQDGEVFTNTIEQINNMIQRCCAIQQSNIFLLKQLYVFQVLFLWTKLKNVQDLHVDRQKDSWSLMLLGRSEMNQRIHYVTVKEEYYAHDELVNKWMCEVDIEIEKHIQLYGIPYDILNPLFAQSSSDERLVPYSVTCRSDYRAIFGNIVLKAYTNGLSYKITLNDVAYEINSNSGVITREVTLESKKYRFQFVNLDQLLSEKHENKNLIQKITDLIPLILLEKNHSIWVNLASDSSITFILCENNTPAWVSDLSYGNLYAVRKNEQQQLLIDRNTILMFPGTLEQHIPWALKFEHKWYIECKGRIKSGHTEPTHVYFKRYGLGLIKSEEDQWYLQGNPKCFLKINGKIPIAHFSNFLLFEDHETHKIFAYIPFLRKSHLEINSDGEYTKNCCEHGNYIQALDIFIHEEISESKYTDFLPKIRSIIVDTCKTELSKTRKFMEVPLTKDLITIEVQNLDPIKLWYLVYIYLSQHQPDRAIKLLQELKKKVCFSDLQEYVVLRAIFCEIPAKLAKTINGSQFEVKANISNPDYVLAKLHALFIFASHRALTFSALNLIPAENPFYSLVKELVGSKDGEFLDEILEVIEAYIHLKTSVNFEKPSSYDSTDSNQLLESYEINIILMFIYKYKEQLVQSRIEQLENKQLLLSAEKIREKDNIDKQIQQLKRICYLFDCYYSYHSTQYFSKPEFRSRSDIFDYADYRTKITGLANADLALLDVSQQVVDRYQAQSGHSLRPIQIDCLKLSSERNQLFKIAMNSGKTKVILPCQASRYADGVSLVTIIFPSELFEVNSRDFKKTCVEYLGQKVYEFTFDRNAYFGAADFSCLLYTLHEIVSSKGCITTTMESLAALQLTFLEVISYCSTSLETEPELAKKIDLLRQILLLFANQGVFFVDEIDTSCDFKKRNLIYPIGNPSTPQEEIFDLVIHSYDILSKLPQIQPYIVAGNGLPKEQLDNWDTLSPIIINALVANQQVVGLCKDLSGRAINKEKVLVFLHNKNGLQAKSIFLGCLYDLIHHVLPLALSRYLNQHFGFSHIEKDLIKRHWAIPYKSSNVPNEGSTYSKYLLTLWLTVEVVKVQGVFKELLEQILISYQRKYMMAIIPLKDLNADFQKLFHGKDICNIQKYLNNSAFYEEFCRSDAVVTYCLRQFILPSVQRYDAQLISTPFNFGRQAFMLKGFTGTSRNNSFLTPMQLVDLTPDSEEILCSKLRADVTPGKIRALDMNDYQLIIKQIKTLIKEDRAIQSVIDIGGWFRGNSNEQVAKDLFGRAELTKSEWVIFFKNGKLYALFKDLKQEIFLESSNQEYLLQKLSCSLDQIFIYIDQQHTRGTDLPQTITAKGIVTVSANTILVDFLQGCMRMRCLLDGPNGASGQQSVIILVSEELNKKCSNFINLEQVLRNNQEEEVSKDAPQAIIEQMRDHLRQLIFNKILSCDNHMEMHQILEQCKDLFFVQPPLEDSLYIEKEIPTKYMLTDYANKLVAFYSSLPIATSNEAEKKQVVIKLKADLNKILESKQEICKQQSLVKSTTALRSLSLQQPIDQECQTLMKAAIKNSLQSWDANECQISSSHESEHSEELHTQNEREAKKHKAHAYSVAKPYNMAFMHREWVSTNFESVSSDEQNLYGMRFYQVSKLLEVLGCQISEDIYMSENFAYTLRTQQKPCISKPMFYVLGFATDDAAKYIIVSYLDIITLYSSFKLLFEDSTTGNKHYIWLEAIQSGLLMGHKPDQEHTQFKNLTLLWEQVQFCAGNVQYFLNMFQQNTLFWLTTNNVENKLIMLNKIVSNHHFEQKEYIDQLNRAILASKLMHTNAQDKNNSSGSPIIRDDPILIRFSQVLPKEVKLRQEIINEETIENMEGQSADAARVCNVLAAHLVLP